MPTDADRVVVGIDEHNLDKECIKLPTQYLNAAHAAAEAKRDYDELAAELAVAVAEMSKEVREKPEDYGIDKITETALTNTVKCLPRIVKKEARCRAAKHDYEMKQALVWALEHKKRTLTLLVDLHGMSYFSAPKVTKEGREAVQEMTKRSIRGRRNDEE